MFDIEQEPKVYRASLLGYLLAVATDGDEGELEEHRATTLRISRIGAADSKGRMTMLEFNGCSLIDTVLAAQEAGLEFESLAMSEPCGKVNRIYVQSRAITAAAAESDDAISFRASLGTATGLLTVHPFEDEDDDDSYLRIMEVRLGTSGESFLVCGEDVHACVDVVKRNFTVHRVVSERPDHRKERAKLTTPWREGKAEQ